MILVPVMISVLVMTVVLVAHPRPRGTLDLVPVMTLVAAVVPS